MIQRWYADAGIIPISTHCTGLQLLNREWCDDISDASLRAIAMNCTGLQSLCTQGCDRLSSDELLFVSSQYLSIKFPNYMHAHKATLYCDE